MEKGKKGLEEEGIVRVDKRPRETIFGSLERDRSF